MAKNLKLNIKNAQLAEALKGKATAVAVPEKKGPAARPAKPHEPESAQPAKATGPESAIVVKRKTRIIQAPSQTTAAPAQELPTAAPAEVEAPVELPEEVVEAPPVKHPEPASQPVVEKTHPAPQAPTSQPAAPRPAQPSKPAEAAQPQAPIRRDMRPKELRPTVGKPKEARGFDARDRQGLRSIDDEAWRKKRAFKPSFRKTDEQIIRPKSLSVRLPVTVKDLAQDMKLKASQLIAKLFMKGIIKTLNDPLDDETLVQMLGLDFDCEITIDTSEEKRIRITDQTIRQEIEKAPIERLEIRPPVVAFMGHVDHGKTSLIDAIRKSNRAAQEAGAITQHIGAFKVTTAAGDVTILDTPGHEAFTEMRARGANVTDIVVLVVAGDEGIRAQTEEAIRQAREANVTIVVALNKCDKPGFDEARVYRELADRELLPEPWGGTTLVVNTSATTFKGIPELLEMIALQAEVMELRADPTSRARGTVLESEMHKGLGAVATILIQNGTLRKGDALVFGHFWGRIKTMQDEFGRTVEAAGPSVPVKVTGLSELAIAGEEFIVVKSEKEARELAEARAEGHKLSLQQAARMSSLERMTAKREGSEIKILPLILRADVQGSLEALKTSLGKVHSKKVRLEIINTGVGEISESDIELAAASKASIVGFHTSVESHAAELIKIKGVTVYTNDIIYHVVDEVKRIMKGLLDKIEQESDMGVAQVKAVFRSSQLGLIAGCQVISGIIKRNALVRQVRKKEVIWKGKISSLKRVKEDVKEVKEGFECGILLEGQKDVQVDDLFEAYEITYLEQEL